MAAGWLLAIESASDTASVALLRDGALAGVRRLGAKPPASERLLPALLDLLAEASLVPRAVDAFAVSIGPGSFTGLRIGVATVKGLAFGDERPVVAVPTLAALAHAALRRAPDASDLCLVALDARRGEVYAAGYEPAGDWAKPRFGPSVYTPGELAAQLGRAGAQRIRLVSPERGLAAALREHCAAPLVTLEGDDAAPDAVAVGGLGWQWLEAGRVTTASALAPSYARRAEAEVRRTGLRLEPAEPL